MFNSNNIKRKYYTIRKNSLGSRYIKVKNIIIISMVVTLIINYIFSYSNLYYNIYNIVPDSVDQLYRIIYVSINYIEIDMIDHGDFDLYRKYYVFFLFNIIIVILYPVITLFFVKSVENQNKSFLIKYIFGMIAAIMSFSMFILFTNSAGYGNVRFPMYPLIGMGEFFFIRDTAFFYVIAGISIETCIMMKIVCATSIKRS